MMRLITRLPYVLMIDAANFANVPDSIIKVTGGYGMFYTTGSNPGQPTPEYEIRRFRYGMKIAQDNDPNRAKGARFADCEPGAFTPEKARDFVHYRRELGHTDGGIYVDRDQFPIVADIMGSTPWRCILATLDGTIYKTYKGKILEGCQFKEVGGKYDFTAMFFPRHLAKIGGGLTKINLG